MMVERCCAFTGHRPKKFPWGYDETDVRCVALKRTLSGQIATLVDAGYTDFLSGMAEGSDTWAALAVFALKKENPALKLHCVLPCEGQADQCNRQISRRIKGRHLSACALRWRPAVLL